MVRRVAAVLLVLALAGAVAGPATAKKKKPKPKPPVAVATTYHMNWEGDCAGAGFLSLTATPNPDSCALFFPELGSTYGFAGSEGLPFALDATQPATVDFTLDSVISAAAEFEALLSAEVNGEQVDVASATATVTAANQSTALHFDLEPDAALDKAVPAGLNLTITWTDGVTYSQMDLNGAPASLVIHGFK